MKTVLLTGAAGFIGRNLLEGLDRKEGLTVRAYDVNNAEAELDRYLGEADIVFHLAGINRPKTEAEFATGNAGLTQGICRKLKSLGRGPKIVFASSIQAALDNPYGISKREAEECLRRYSAETGADVAIYRLRNVFGKWCQANYNSVVATFCHNVARDLPIQITDPTHELELVYVDDVVAAFLEELGTVQTGADFKEVPSFHRVTLGRLAELLHSYRASRGTLITPDLSGSLAGKLYATFLSHLPEDGFAYSLDKKTDDRGDLAEFIKSASFGQIFVSRTKPGITRGNHYHHTKTEKFLVLDGEAVIRFRHIEREDIIEYGVSGRELKVVDIPPGYTHSIENVGKGEMVVLFWASEIFDPKRPDTYFLTVETEVGRRKHAA